MGPPPRRVVRSTAAPRPTVTRPLPPRFEERPVNAYSRTSRQPRVGHCDIERHAKPWNRVSALGTACATGNPALLFHGSCEQFAFGGPHPFV
ncbi:hypothetical protein MRX96_055712 [Rhipicephalus microplus]